MDILALLLLLSGAIWYGLDCLRALEIARNAGRRVCMDANLQFLDDTVENIKTSLTRNGDGRRVLRRSYRFEFSETGNSRLEGILILLGDRIESVWLEPYQIQDETGCKDTTVPAMHPSAATKAIPEVRAD